MLKPVAERDPANWEEFARCAPDPESMYVEGAEQNVAKRKCMGCLARYACLVDALETNQEWGVRGGTTERERRKIHKDHPGFPWRRALRSELSLQLRQREAAVQIAKAEVMGNTVPLSVTVVRVPRPQQAPVAAEVAAVEDVSAPRESAEVAPEVESAATAA